MMYVMVKSPGKRLRCISKGHLHTSITLTLILSNYRHTFGPITAWWHLSAHSANHARAIVRRCLRTPTRALDNPLLTDRICNWSSDPSTVGSYTWISSQLSSRVPWDPNYGPSPKTRTVRNLHTKP